MGSFEVEWKRTALRDLRRLDRQAIPRIVAAVESLRDGPFPSGSRKLTGGQHSYRLRVGKYRVIYEVLQSRLVIEVVRVRHREDAYRR